MPVMPVTVLDVTAAAFTLIVDFDGVTQVKSKVSHRKAAEWLRDVADWCDAEAGAAES